MTGITDFFKKKRINYVRTTDQLRRVLYRQSNELSETALGDTRSVSTAQIEALERIHRLIEITESAQLSRKRWPVVVALGSTLLLMSVLLFARVDTTAIDLDLKVSELSFTLKEPRMLTGILRLSELGIAGLERIHVPRSHNNPGRDINAPDFRGSIYLSSTLQGDHSGSVTLAPLELPAGTQVSARITGGVNQYRLSLKGTGLKIRLAVEGSVGISLNNEPSRVVVFGSPKSVLLQPGLDELDIDMTLPAMLQDAFASQFPVSNIILARIEQVMDSAGTYVRRASTIRSGSLFFEELNARKWELRPAETLRFKHSQGVILSLALHNDHLALRFHGLVKDMTTGPTQNPRSLMPTYLEWLKAQQGLVLLWGASIYVFLLVVGVLRWWGIKV